MEIVVERREGVVIVAVAGSVDGMTAGELVTSMLEQVSAGNPRLVGNLSGVDYTSMLAVRRAGG